MRKRIILFAFILLVAYSCQKSSQKSMEKLEYPHYNINLEVNPETQEINVQGDLLVNLAKDTSERPFFYLQRDLNISSFAINGEDVAVIDTAKSDNRFMPQARKIFLKEKALSMDQPVRIDFSYSGKLGDLPNIYANRIGPDWTEIGVYYPWFPYNPDQIRMITYNVDVRTNKGYTAFGIGQVEEKKEFTTIKSSLPTTDIVVCLSQDVNTYKASLGQNELKIFHHGFPDSLLQGMASNVSGAYDYYNKWYGTKNMDVSIIDTKREMGGGYARIGGMVLGGIKPESYFSNLEGYSRYFAHELAHLWWFNAKVTSWEDWLNESMAEYSALMVLREKFGQETFNKRLENKKKDLEGTLPIWGFDRNNAEYKIAHKVLYDKGPVLLAKLEEKIGHKNFVEFTKQLIGENVKTTKKFLSVLKSTNGEEVATWFEGLLKTS